MKLCIWLVLMSGGTAAFVAAQTPVTVPSPFQTPALPVAAQKPPVSPDTVVLTVEGKPYKAKELDEWLAQFPPQVKDAVTLDVKMGQLPDGTVYAADSTLNVKSQKLTVAVQNSGYRRSN